MPLEKLLSYCSRFTLLNFVLTVTTDNYQNIHENSFIILNGLLNAFCYRHFHNYTRDRTLELETSSGLNLRLRAQLVSKTIFLTCNSILIGC